MAEQKTVLEFFAQLKESWGSIESLPGGVRDQVSGAEPSLTSGERFGTWFLEIVWLAEGLSRSASVGLTPAGARTEDASVQAVVTVRAAASSEERFIAENVYEQRRAVARLSVVDLESYWEAAVQRAAQYSERSLVSSYETGIPEG